MSADATPVRIQAAGAAATDSAMAGSYEGARAASRPKPPADSVATLQRRADALLPAIGLDAATRERDRLLPYGALRRLADDGLYTFRIPQALGGPGGGIGDLIRFVIDLASVDANAAQAMRPGFGFVEQLRLENDPVALDRWVPRLLGGEVFGNAGWERGGPNGQVTMRLRPDPARPDGWLASGTKYYSTGALYADWISTIALDEDGREITFVVPRDRDGLFLVDDFDAMGQRLTASGTTRYENVSVARHELRPRPPRERRSPIPAFYQLYLAAVEAGIAINVREDALRFARQHARPIRHSSASRSVDDPYVQQAVGEIASHAWAAEAAVLRAAARLEAWWEGDQDLAGLTAVSIEVAQAQVAAIRSALAAGERLFDVGSASATQRLHNLDRHWRNARTVANHNPRDWKSAVVGAWWLKGAEPPTSGLF